MNVGVTAIGRYRGGSMLQNLRDRDVDRLRPDGRDGHPPATVHEAPL